MVSELRAPDPTLDAMPSGAIVYLTGTNGPRISHTVGGQCGAQLHHPERASDAAYFAVPCRECFPEAPPPGQRLFEFRDTKPVTWGYVHSEHLGWQVAG